jgi:hypothetical protein
MNWDALGAIGDFVSGMGVIVTLGYLAVQIRSNTNLVRGQAQRERDRSIGSQFFVSTELLAALTGIQKKVGTDDHQSRTPSDRKRYFISPCAST